MEIGDFGEFARLGNNEEVAIFEAYAAIR